MFSKKIVDSDSFLELPTSAQNLYFHLNMRADDDGFVNNPRMVMRIVEADAEDLARLVREGFLLSFDNGVVAVTHWRIHNQLRKDRYNPTQYQEQFASLTIQPNGAYALAPVPAPAPWRTESPFGSQTATGWQPRIG